jgi:hypothetical protein
MPLFVYTVEIPASRGPALCGPQSPWHHAGTFDTPAGATFWAVQTTSYYEASMALDLDDLFAQEQAQEKAFAEKHSWYKPRKLLVF